jgi:hypothetical protein
MLRWLATIGGVWRAASSAIGSALLKVGLGKRSARQAENLNGHVREDGAGTRAECPLSVQAPSAVSLEQDDLAGQAVRTGAGSQEAVSFERRPQEHGSEGADTPALAKPADSTGPKQPEEEAALSVGQVPTKVQQEVTARRESGTRGQRVGASKPGECTAERKDAGGQAEKILLKPRCEKIAQPESAAADRESQCVGTPRDGVVVAEAAAAAEPHLSGMQGTGPGEIAKSGEGRAAELWDGAPALEQSPGENAMPEPLSPSRAGTVYKDRRGARRSTPKSGRRPPAPTTQTVRQAELRLRLVVDPVVRAVGLSAVLVRGHEFPDRVRTGFADAEELLAFEGRYDDLAVDWTPDLLRRELRLADVAGSFEWVRGAREIHIFAEESGESDLMSVPAAVLNMRHAVVCPSPEVAAVLAIASSAQSPPPTVLQGWHGIPAGWAVLDGYKPQCPADPPPDGHLRTLDPGTTVEILFEGGLQIRSRTWAAGRPPTIRVSALPPNGAIFIDACLATVSPEGICTAQNWDRPGTHLVDVVPGRSASYEIAADPALEAGWHETVGMQVGIGSICGPRIVSPKARAVLASPVSGRVVAVGKYRHAKVLQTRAGLPAAIGALSFKPEFLIVSWGSRRSQGEIVWLALSNRDDTAAAPDAAWVSAIRSATAHHFAIRPASEEARQAWARAASVARRYRKGRT